MSMGPIAARHARTVLAHVEQILAIELLVATQALDARVGADGPRPGAGVAEARQRVRGRVGPGRMTASRARPRGGARPRPGPARSPASRAVARPRTRRRLRPMRDPDRRRRRRRPRFGLVPPCADPGFDHRTCDYWEDADRGSKAAAPRGSRRRRRPAAASFDRRPTRSRRTTTRPAVNPFAPAPATGPAFNPFADATTTRSPTTHSPRRARPGRRSAPMRPASSTLLGRGLGVFGTYAKVLLADDEPAAYAQFGPLSAYPRALRLRDLYPQLPDAPLPAVITCIATTAEGAASRPRPGRSSRRSATTWGGAGSRPSRRTRSAAPGRTRRARPRPRSG